MGIIGVNLHGELSQPSATSRGLSAAMPDVPEKVPRAEWDELEISMLFQGQKIIQSFT
jgi:hypothetical protein